MVFTKYFLNQHRYSRNQGIVGKLVEREIFSKFQVSVELTQTGAIDDQNFEFLLNNFARLTNIISGECPTFPLFKSVFRLHLLYVVFMLCALKVKGFENFQAFAFCLKLRVNRGMLRFSIAFITVQVQ